MDFSALTGSHVASGRNLLFKYIKQGLQAANPVCLQPELQGFTLITFTLNYWWQGWQYLELTVSVLRIIHGGV